MKWDEQARRLQSKAEQDEQAMHILMEASSAADEIIGFHAQQAVEKLLKALLSNRRVTFRRTHDLTELIDLLAAKGVQVPSRIAEARRLGPYAAEFRYEDIPLDTVESLDRNWVLQCVAEVKAWVDQQMDQSREP